MKIAAFNVQKLAAKKVNNEAVCKSLIKIVSRYSVVVMLEVIDQSGKVMKKFLSKLNSYGRNRNHPFTMKCSKPLGRGFYKEKFVFFYREDEVTMLDSYQYEEDEAEEEDEEEEYEEEYEEEDEEEEDEKVDLLIREPFILRFKCPNTVVQDLVLIPVHTKPEDAHIELDALGDVVDAARKRWGTDKIMILGDFNAGGRYLTKKKKAESRLCSADYHWLIDDDVDTTTSNRNNHTYDRIVVFGKTMLNAIVPGSAKSFNFQTEFRLTEKDAQSISDHYPVEVELKTRAQRRKRTA
ncbi:deoxyribonuclease-1-like [Cebidichthys violaceus]|uniref:deoxyribonuclease-1-like n=1 Tax=Cebidichthys violaceus TaxID=271503 RepID=UPI0035C9D592